MRREVNVPLLAFIGLTLDTIAEDCLGMQADSTTGAEKRQAAPPQAPPSPPAQAPSPRPPGVLC